MKIQTKLVLLSYVIFGIMSVTFINLYYQHYKDKFGNFLDFNDIIKNIFGCFNRDINFKKPKKEVFSINENNFTYDEAKLVCKALNSELATYAQVVKAHKNGANWCNYGWTKNKMALFPIQQSYHDKIQKNKDTKNTCGKPGVNGGYFPNGNLKFSANCYGNKPTPNPDNIIYIDNDQRTTSVVHDIKNTKNEDIISKYKNKFKNSNFNIVPFNNDKWSSYSFKKSRYILPPINPNKKIEQITEVFTQKDPRQIQSEN